MTPDARQCITRAIRDMTGTAPCTDPDPAEAVTAASSLARAAATAVRAHVIRARSAGSTWAQVAAAIGTATHVAGDMLTDCGCPLLWPATMREFHLLPGPLRFTTGKLAEHAVITPLLVIALGLLIYRDASSVPLIHHAQTALTARSAP